MNSQKIISKKEEKKSSKSASLLLQLDRNKIQNRNKNKNLEILKKPRSKEYVRLVLAMESLGKEIEEVENSELDVREKYWINYYDSYNNGYNSTLGGKLVELYNWDIEEKIKLYNQYRSARKVA